jgi:hypothetical protein
MFEKIQIAYWRGYKYSDIQFEHDQHFEYSEAMFCAILSHILNNNKNIKIQQSPDFKKVTVWIDDKNFRQT